MDVPWVDDAQRFFSTPSERRAFFDQCERALVSRERSYVTISGDWTQRFTAARTAVDALLRMKSELGLKIRLE